MSDSTVIRNARLVQRPGLYQISIERHQILEIKPMGEALPTRQDSIRTQDSVRTIDSAVEGRAIDEDHAIDIEGDWISLGAVDLQINGALGLAFPDLRLAELDRLQTICELLWQQGVDGFCPTLVTTSLENFHGSLAAIQAFQQQVPRQKNSAKILGVHLEGPFLNEAKRGAHPAAFLQPLTLENVKTVIGEYADTVSIMTLAPELEAETINQQQRVIAWLKQQGITVSLGHSLATAQQASQAFDQGATMVTHAFNAMPGLHHREPGLLGAALTDSRVFCGFIADGQHICQTMLRLLLRAGRGSDCSFLGGLCLVSDALSPLGLPDGQYPWDDRQIEVVNGTARLADGTLSGTTLPLLDGAANLVKWELCSVEEAIALVTQAPRKALGLSNCDLSTFELSNLEASHLEISSPAQLIRWHQATDGQLSWARLSA